MVAKGCTIPCIHPPYGLEVSNSRPIATSRVNSCGPAYTSKATAPSASGITTCPSACVTSLPVRTPPVNPTSANPGAPAGVSTPTRKYLFLATAQVMGPPSSFRSPGSRSRKGTPSAPCFSTL